MTEFTPISGLIGGMMIGLAAVLFLLLNGRIAGISGIAGGMIGGRAGELGWRAAFVAGLIVGPLIVAAITGSMATVTVSTTWPWLIVAGLLVGFGTRLGAGCTSGHGVCGLARGSRRSFVATALFFAVALATVFVTRHLLQGA
jgi:uncharacterized membrane protein YedE/YeeE